jgi:hypothetical protein
MFQRTKSIGKMNWCAGFVMIGLLAVVHAAHADDQLQPKAVLQVGQKWDFSEDGSQTMDMQVGGQPLKQIMKHTRKGTVEVLAVKDGNPTAIKVTFDQSCGDKGSQNDQANDLPFPLAGKIVIIKKDDLCIVTIQGAATNEATTNELSQMLSPMHPILPKTAASVGDAWDGNPDATNKEFELGPNDTAEVKCKFTKVGQVGDRKTADVNVTGHIKKNQNGLNFTFDLKGTARVDLLSGQTLDSTMTGQTTVQGQTQGPQGAPVNVQGNGTMDNHQVMQLTGGGDAAAGGNGLPTSSGNAPTAGGSPAANNPLGGGGTDSPFAGEYHGDKLSAVFTADGQGQFKGTIQMGEQKFPATAKVDSGKLVGTFTVQGSSFDFTAVLDNGTMTLSSGGTDYTMKKAVANPLSGGGSSGPRNPLSN